MDTHVRTLGTVNILFGVCSALLGLVVLIAYGGPFGLYNAFADNILGLLIAGSVTFNLLLSVPCIVGGVYLRSFAEWSRGLVIVTSALNILNPPAGSIIGCYGLWVLLTPETDPLFSNPPPDRRPKKAAEAVASTVRSHVMTQPEKTASTTIIPSPRS
jgi:hypothetical protein